jgi:hypothetical protein
MYNVTNICDILSCSSYVKRRFEGTYHLHLHGRKSTEEETSLQQVTKHMLTTRSVFVSIPIMEVICSSHTDYMALYRSYCCENLKLYMNYFIQSFRQK